MKLPTAEQYNVYVQNAALFFKDPRIQQYKVAVDSFGLPDVLSGGFAYTYRFVGGGPPIAIRCFHKPIDSILRRYESIASFLSGINSRFFVGFKFQGDGIVAEGRKLPTVEMEWVEGQTLFDYLGRHYQDPQKLVKIRAELAAFAKESHRLQFAHGDIQLRNILVTDQGMIKLVDYDSMFVPSLAGLSSADEGHPHFQSPHRTASMFGPYIDRFPLAVLDLSLEALIANPKLFERFHRAENVILGKQDFSNPHSSDVLSEIERLPGLASKVERFREFCSLSPERIPSHGLASSAEIGRSGGPSIDFEEVEEEETYVSNYPVVLGSSYKQCEAYVGQQAEIVGQIVRTFQSGNIMLLRFGIKYNKVPAVIVPIELYNQLKLDLTGRWVSVSGVLKRHKSGSYSTVQVALKERADLELLHGQDDVEFRLGRSSRKRTVRRPISKTKVRPAPIHPPNLTTVKDPEWMQPSPAPQPKGSANGPANNSHATASASNNEMPWWADHEPTGSHRASSSGMTHSPTTATPPRSPSPPQASPTPSLSGGTRSLGQIITSLARRFFGP